MLVFHPIIVHFPIVAWLLVFTSAIFEHDQSAAKRTILLSALAWLATLSALATGLWDEAQGREMLARGWMLDDHRFAGIITLVASSFCAMGIYTHRQRRPLPTWIAWACVFAPIVICVTTLYLGHQAVHTAPWTPLGTQLWYDMPHIHGVLV